MLTAMFLNTWGGSISKALSEFVRERAKDVDVMCFTEVHHCVAKNVPTYVHAKKAGHRVFATHMKQYEMLREILGATHDGYFAPEMQFHLSDVETIDQPALYGLAMFIRKGIPVIDFRSGMLSRLYNKKYDSTPASRAIQSACMVIDDVTYVVAHFHGLWIPEGKHDTEHRFTQSRAVDRFVYSQVENERLLSGVRPKVILGGDFNLMSGSQSLRILQIGDMFRLAEALNLNNEFEIHDTRTHYYPAHKLTREADFVLVSRDVDVTSYEALAEPVVSDHKPLILKCS